MRRDSLTLERNPRTDTFYIKQTFATGRTIEHQRGATGLEFAIQYKYADGWRDVNSFETRRECEMAWPARSGHWRARMIARAECCELRIKGDR